MLSLLTCKWSHYMIAIALYHSGAHLMKPQFPVNLRTTLSQGCHTRYFLQFSHNFTTLYKIVTMWLQPCEVVNWL